MNTLLHFLLLCQSWRSLRSVGLSFGGRILGLIKVLITVGWERWRHQRGPFLVLPRAPNLKPTIGADTPLPISSSLTFRDFVPFSTAVKNRVREGPVNDVVSHWRLSNNWKLIQSTNKNLSKFVSEGGDMASSASFCATALNGDFWTFSGIFGKVWKCVKWIISVYFVIKSDSIFNTLWRFDFMLHHCRFSDL